MSPVRSIRPYRRVFASPLKTGAGAFAERTGWLLREESNGRVSFAEVCPFPGFGGETPGWRDSLKEWSEGSDLMLDEQEGCLGFAGWSLRQVLPTEVNVSSAILVKSVRELNTESLSRGGAKTIKVKVGVGNRSEERQQIKTLIGEAKGDVRIRLDANQVFDLGQTADWIEWASDLQEIEFIEQPMPVGSEEMIFDEFGEEARKIALDESVVSEASLDRFLDMDWPGPFVIKPSLFGNPESLIALPESVRGRLVLSSAFETGIGFSWVLALADQLVGKKRDHGLGTRGWFGADGLDGWSAGTHFSGEITEERLEKVWNNAAVF